MDYDKILHKCEHCNQIKEDVEYTVNPYILELEDIEVYEYICNDCYDHLLNDV